jgi:transposase
MCMRRVEMDRLQELVRLHRMGTGAREVARMLQVSPNTEREYRRALAKEGLLDGDAEDVPSLEVLRAAVERHLPVVAPPQMVSTAEPVRDRIVELAERGLKPQAIYDRLRLEDPSFTASFWAVRGAWRKWCKARGVRAEDVAIPVETGPGEIAQVDFGYVGKLYDAASGVLRKAWVFVMVLAFSRRMVARIVFDQKIETWLRVHVEAFAELGGVPATIVPDNLKAAVIRAAFGIDGAAGLNRSYRELARHYGFKIDPAPIYAPKKKGKVESAVKYVKGNFFAGRDEHDADDTQCELQRWVDEIANVRVHGTTHRRPIDLFADEQAALLPIPDRRYELVTWHEATVHQDSHVAFDKRLYSVPWPLIEQRVWVRATPSSVVILANDVRVATHDRRGRSARSTCDEHLPEDRAPWRHRSRAYWEARADRIAPEVGAYVRAVFDSDDVLSMLRTVQAVVTHLEKFPVERAVATCMRAHHYGSYQYRTIKNILRDGLDLQPVAPTPPSGVLAAPRFARPIGELFHRIEVNHEHN